MLAPSRKRTTRLLSVVFLTALVMGPGPGGYLIDSATDPRVWFGMPALYVWAVGWFFVQAAVVLAAALLLWQDGEGEGMGESP